MTTLTKLNHQSFDQKIAKSDRLSIIKFGADWCGPCRMIEPVLASIADKHKELDVYEVDVDQEPALAQRFGVRGIPSVFFMKNNKIVDSFTGARPESDINKMINRLTQS